MKSKYDDLKWHIESIAAGGSFTVPPRKIYECFFSQTNVAAIGLFRVNLRDLTNIALYNIWYPFAISWETATNTVMAVSLPHGWLFSEEDKITNDNALSTFVVRWRDVTALYCDEL